MTYIGTMTYDYASDGDSNARARLANALDQAVWSYSGRTAMVLDSDSLDEFRLGLEVLARTLEEPGTLTAFSMQIQQVGEARRPPNAKNHQRALRRVLTADLPSEERRKRVLAYKPTKFDLAADDWSEDGPGEGDPGE